MQKVLKTGNSIGVTIPSKFAKSVGIKIGDQVKVKTILETGKVVYTFKGVKQLSMDSTINKIQ